MGQVVLIKVTPTVPTKFSEVIRFQQSAPNNNKNNNILYSSHQEIKAVVRSRSEEHISIILSQETHAHTHP